MSEQSGSSHGHEMPQDISREEILKQIFGDVGELINDFSCAVESTILLHGRMYVTNKFICFYSNLFGLEKKIRIPYSHIKTIAKEYTAKVIPNAISIFTDKKHYIFRSFWDRDDCFKMLSLFLRKFKAGNDNSLENLIASPPPPFGASSPTPSTASEPAQQTAPLLKSNPDISAGSISEATPAKPRSKSIGTGTLRTVTGSTASEEDEVDMESNNRDRRESVVAGVNRDCETMLNSEAEKAKLKLSVISEELEISVEDFFKLFIDEGAPYNFKKYHESINDSNVVLSSWIDESAVKTGQSSRELKFFKPVNLPGLASTRGVKVQRLVRCASSGLVLCSSTRLEDVPAADTFCVDDTLTIRARGAHTVLVEISFEVKFLKSTFMKYLIETNTNTELTKWLQSYFEHLKKITALFKEGKIDLSVPNAEVAALLAPNTADVAAEKKAVAEAVRVESAKAAELDAKRRAKHDYLRLLFYIFMIILLFFNYLRWSSSNAKVSEMQKTIEQLEKVIHQFVQSQSTCTK